MYDSTSLSYAPLTSELTENRYRAGTTRLVGDVDDESPDLSRILRMVMLKAEVDRAKEGVGGKEGRRNGGVDRSVEAERLEKGKKGRSSRGLSK